MLCIAIPNRKRDGNLPGISKCESDSEQSEPESGVVFCITPNTVSSYPKDFLRAIYVREIFIAPKWLIYYYE